MKNVRCPKCDRYCFYFLTLNKYKCACRATWKQKDVDYQFIEKKGACDYG